MSKDMLRVLVPTGMLGYGFPIEDFKKGLSMSPDFISVDSGSTDSGPQKLALGSTTCSRAAYEEELEIIISGGLQNQIPVFISSAGGDGSNIHVNAFADIVRDLAKKNQWKLRMALIYADIEKDVVTDKLQKHSILPCGPVDSLTEKDVEDATVIVAQMGAEPFLKVLENDPDINVVISGRSYDPSPIAAMSLFHGFDPGLAWHMGKIVECGGLCTTPSSRCIIAELYRDHFDLIPLGKDAKCTPYSVAAHTLYEKSHPYLLPGPGGTLDLKNARFEALSDSVVRVSGSKYVPSPEYTVKLEGARVCGFRAICIAGVRDPILISQIDPFLEGVKKTVYAMKKELLEDAQLIFHVYGRNGVMGALEPNPNFVPQELCIIIEVAAPTQEQATAICNRARIALLHNPYEGRMATSGNVGLPFTPLEIELGAVCEFNVYHLMKAEDPEALFPIQYEEVM